ncbi:hypothetical protein [Pontibacter pamirensis]|uniref:hypothetical protein n=1 Tax=Pontibacter pamirensis TaxID=2562824 RepID=UPI0013896C01|nr:hypothetical protein [Pontibacter pamirensis]
MKRNLILIMLTLVLQNALAQDYILKVNGDEIPARVLEITLEEILYHQPDSSAAAVLRLPKKEVFMIRFENGTKEVFTENLPGNEVVTAQALSPDQLYLLGKRDAIQYYKGNGVLWGSAASALIVPYGLAGSAVLAFTPPNVHQNRVSDMVLLSYPTYVKGYKEQAKKKKIGKAAAGAGIGTLVGIAATVAIVLSTWQ